MVIPEEKEQGTISYMTYYRYFRAGGSAALVIAVFLSVLVGEVRTSMHTCTTWWDIFLNF